MPKLVSYDTVMFNHATARRDEAGKWHIHLNMTVGAPTGERYPTSYQAEVPEDAMAVLDALLADAIAAVKRREGI